MAEISAEALREYYSEIGKRGKGKTSTRKAQSSRNNLVAARAARWGNKRRKKKEAVNG